MLFDWLAREGDTDRRLALLEWLTVLADDPLRHARRVPAIRAPVYIVFAPLRPTPVVVRFLLAEQYHTVKLIDIRPLR